MVPASLIGLFWQIKLLKAKDAFTNVYSYRINEPHTSPVMEKIYLKIK